ncbi:hypothetical protein [Compostibacter hankyongensis]|uniref:HTH cro/C1-type domain-containing protein n=1 Tax=Compostibacter hankyongensis TaxID=1007089 RepID=A0ABP8G9A8_9BACT
MQPIVRRLDAYIKYRELNPNRFSEMLGYASPEKIYRLFREENAKPGVDILIDISNIFEDLNMQWVLTGKGEMLKKEAVSCPPGQQGGGPEVQEYLKCEEKERLIAAQQGHITALERLIEEKEKRVQEKDFIIQELRKKITPETTRGGPFKETGRRKAG